MVTGPLFNVPRHPCYNYSKCWVPLSRHQKQILLCHVDFGVTNSPQLRPSPRREPVHRTQTTRHTWNRFLKRRIVFARSAFPRFLTGTPLILFLRRRWRVAVLKIGFLNRFSSSTGSENSANALEETGFLSPRWRRRLLPRDGGTGGDGGKGGGGGGVGGGRNWSLTSS